MTGKSTSRRVHAGHARVLRVPSALGPLQTANVPATHFDYPIKHMEHKKPREVSRRKWLQLAAASSVIGPLFKLPETPVHAQTKPSSNVNKFSSPSNLKITDIRACLVAANFDYPIIRIDTNQAVYGLGECFAGSTMGSALVLKAHLVGKNPLDIERILVLPR